MLGGANQVCLAEEAEEAVKAVCGAQPGLARTIVLLLKGCDYWHVPPRKA